MYKAAGNFLHNIVRKFPMNDIVPEDDNAQNKLVRLRVPNCRQK